MPSCERISPQQFHSRGSRLYTEQCVQHLMESKSFRDYVSHVEYTETLYLTWIVAPIGLTIAFYFHLFSLLGGEGVWLGPPSAPHDGGGRSSDNLTLMCWATVILLLFIAPCVVIAPFVGFHEPISRRYAFGLVVLLTCINVSLVSWGGGWLHHPPYLTSSPPVLWQSASLHKAIPLAAVVLARALPLEGAVVAGALVYTWRESRWRRAWHVPLPILTVPILVGVFACVWFRMSSLVIPFFFPAHDADSVHIATVITSVFNVMWEDVTGMIRTGSLPLVFTNPLLRYHAWWTTIILSFGYFGAVLLLPFLRAVFRAVYAVLPTHPTTWSLAFITCVGGLVTLLRQEEAAVGAALGVLAISVMLLHNGFVLG